MTPHVDAHKDLHSEQGATARRAPRALPQPPDQSPRSGVAGIRETRPGPRGSLRAGVRLHHRAAHRRRASPSRNGRRLDVRDRPPRNALAVRGPSVRRTGQGRRRAARQRDREDDPHAARGHRRRRGRTDRSQRDSGPRRRRDARVGRAARTTAAHLQLRARAAPRQRHPAPAARTRPGAEVGSCRAAEHEVHRRHWTGTSTTSG